MNLSIDIGNSRKKTGLFKGQELVESMEVTDWTHEKLVQYCNQKGVRRIMLSSVALPDAPLSALLAQFFDFVELTHETPLPFVNRYATPKTLGKDRLAAVAGAQALYPQQNCLIIDCGTCIKYDIITQDAEYPGGNIAPGANMRAKAMHVFTARLPEVDMQIPESFIGQSTETALKNGAFRGALLEMEGFIQLFEKEFSPLNILLTGGDAAFFEPLLNLPNLTTVPHLTLYGLNNILITTTR